MTGGRRMDLCGYLGIPGSPPVHAPGPQTPSRPQELVQLAPEAILMEEIIFPETGIMYLDEILADGSVLVSASISTVVL